MSTTTTDPATNAQANEVVTLTEAAAREVRTSSSSRNWTRTRCACGWG